MPPEPKSKDQLGLVFKSYREMPAVVNPKRKYVMKKQVKITLFGATGKRTLNITPRGGFPTRHIKAPREIHPSTPAPVKPKSAPEKPKPDEVSPPTLLEVIRWMEASEDHTDWLIIDEILFVATAQYKMKFNHTTLLNALRFLYREGCLAYRLNRFDQHTFQRIESQENHLKTLLSEVDVILSKGEAS